MCFLYPCRIVLNLPSDHITVTDALCVAELRRLPYKIPHLKVDPHEEFSDGTIRPTDPFMTTPNANWCPNVSADRKEVCARTDGRFYTADLSLFPQVYFPKTYYQPYGLARPSLEELPGHRYEVIWYDIDRTRDFVLEPGAINNDLGRIRRDLVEQFVNLRTNLSTEIKTLRNDIPEKLPQFGELNYCETGMLYACIALECAPQSYELTLLTVTSFQRYFLETLACYDYLSYWSLLPAVDTPREVNNTRIGAITAEIEVATRLYMEGVPVWLVRAPSEFLPNTNIINKCWPSLPKGMVSEYLPKVAPIFNGSPSAIRNRACQGLRAHNIRLRHAAYTLGPGELGR